MPKDLFNSDIIQSYKLANINTTKYKTTLLHKHNPCPDNIIYISSV